MTGSNVLPLDPSLAVQLHKDYCTAAAPVFQNLCALYIRLLDPRVHNDVRCEVYCREPYSAAMKGSDLGVR